MFHISDILDLFSLFSKMQPLTVAYRRYSREKYGGLIPNYKKWSEDPFFAIFGVTTKTMSMKRIDMLAVFLAAVYKLEPDFLLQKNEKNQILRELVDLVRLEIMCCLPRVDGARLFTNATMNAIGERHPCAVMKRDKLRRRSLSLKDHYYVGRLFGLEVMADGKPFWTTSVDDMKVEQNMFKQFRLEVLGVSPTTMLMFLGIGGVKAEGESEKNNFMFLFPQMSVSVEGFNQRFISDITRVWKPYDSKRPQDKIGLMQILYDQDSTEFFGNIPYMVYPHHECMLQPSNEEKLEDTPKFKVSSNIHHGSESQDVMTANHDLKVYDIEFESICCAYKAIFNVDFTEVYEIDPELKNRQLLSILALGCLIRDIDYLCDGFKLPDQNLRAIHRYLNKRIYDLIHGSQLIENDDVYRIDRRDFELFFLGLTVEEAFWRIRLMFRFLLGDLFHGLVDGCCRLTSMAYTWVGLQPDTRTKDFFKVHDRVITAEPNYKMMTSPSPLHIIMTGNEYAVKGGNNVISQNVKSLCESNSMETQKAFAKGEELSLQSMILGILGDFQKDIPFRCNFQSNVVVSDGYFEEIAGKDKNKEDKVREQVRFKLLKYLYQRMEMVEQKDYTNAWYSGKNPVTAQKDKIKYMKSVRMDSMNGLYRIVIDMVVRFVLLGSVMEEKDDPQRTFGKSFIELLKTFIENNGKGYQLAGDIVRNTVPCITQPLECLIVEKDLMEYQQMREHLWLNLYTDKSFADLKNHDLNLTSRVVSIQL